jgi:hypothetical protein
LAATAAARRAQETQAMQRFKEVCWKLALSDCIDRLGSVGSDATTNEPLDEEIITTTRSSSPVSMTQSHADRLATILSFAAALGCVVALWGNDCWTTTTRASSHHHQTNDMKRYKPSFATRGTAAAVATTGKAEKVETPTKRRRALTRELSLIEREHIVV